MCAFSENAHILCKLDENVRIFTKMRENVRIFNERPYPAGLLSFISTFIRELKAKSNRGSSHNTVIFSNVCREIKMHLP